eukprot:CAMPEP_0172679286 /NCGR_PEP_ID=MMETSP1074-20121228/15961_1 /TAXON_ID=2916 /ORGANISM="Ceratium fusus, Strain PA161109" /LENGTH=336 /DNA_ID=CAMNT_0013497437 /DNA_START=20 /DNA_END=1031 /DNA_ORIENTATION=-
MSCHWDRAPAMFAMEPLPLQPAAPSPKASGLGSYLSFSRAETLTPESSAGGRPSRASVVDTISPASRQAVDFPGDRLQSIVKERGEASGQQSSRDTQSENGADDARRVLLSGGRSSSALGSRRSPGELRRRKYTALHANLLNKNQQIPEGRQADALVGKQPVVAASSEPDDSEVLVEGPLQERHLLLFWRWRWCVLDRQELRVYWDEEASLLTPERPAARHKVLSLTVAPDLHFPSVLICANADTGEQVMFLRAGPGTRWEEVAATTLWLRAFAAASRSAAARQRGSRISPENVGPSEEDEGLGVADAGSIVMDSWLVLLSTGICDLKAMPRGLLL